MPLLHVVVKGMVQGVGFRWFVREKARTLGLAGWVRNRQDGSVEVVAEGDAGGIHELESLLREGPHGARVDALERVSGSAQGEMPRPFGIRH